jgi:hypothetical protein
MQKQSPLKKLLTVGVPAFFITIVVIAVGLKYVEGERNAPMIKLKTEKIAPALERTARVNKVLFTKHRPNLYKKVTVTVIHDTLLVVKLQSDYFPDNDAELVRMKNDAYAYYKEKICRVPNFKQIAFLPKSVMSKILVPVGAEISQVDSQGVTFWSVKISPNECP